MKPDAPIEYRGPFSPIATRVPGLKICELLPNLARCADKFSLVRTMHHDETDHGIAGTMGLTGSRAGARGLGDANIAGAERPSTGSIVGRLHRGRPGPLPPYVILGDLLHQGKKRVVGEGGGILGSAYDPFRLRYEPGAGVRLPDAQLPENVNASRLEARWDLLRQLDGSPALPAGSVEAIRPPLRAGPHAHRLAAEPLGPRRRARARCRATTIRAAPVRPVLPDRPETGRGGSAVRPGQLEQSCRAGRGQRRRRLGYARPLFRRHAR